jgi:hypothetical protein
MTFFVPVIADLIRNLNPNRRFEKSSAQALRGTKESILQIVQEITSLHYPFDRAQGKHFVRNDAILHIATLIHCHINPLAH